MIKTFTQDDLVRYIYKETTIEENFEIEQAMLFDETLADDYAALIDVVQSLDAIQKEPSDRSIDVILSYSKSYDLHAV
jgi:hypothetical protein